ncbi:Lrp/AsnC ligand binding domain-containing protein [Erwinia sp. S59]|uniref:Lrp/AsnC ligand binding domain-containing protein n=1 Tax=Erwinia sp. S59 TaxID=2769340 RepID=UPI00336C0A8C
MVDCYNVSGGYDYLLKIIAPTISMFQDLMERLLEDDIGIEKFASRIVLRQPCPQRGEPLNVIAYGVTSWK